MIEAEFNRSSVHRPYFVRWWYTWRDWGVVLKWGDRNSDAVWGIGLSIRPRSIPCVPPPCPEPEKVDIYAVYRCVIPALSEADRKALDS